jgi:hypothetical protein
MNIKTLDTDYLYWYRENFFSSKERKKIVSSINKNYIQVEPHNSGAATLEGVSKKKSKTLMIPWGKLKGVTRDLESIINLDNELHFGYNIFPMNDHSYVLLNIYSSEEKGEYDWHTDTSKSPFNETKLTALVNLSESYEGGDFLIFDGGAIKIDVFKPGTLLIIKSHLNHKVEPVTKGTRKTLTIFRHGPRLR